MRDWFLGLVFEKFHGEKRFSHSQKEVLIPVSLFINLKIYNLVHFVQRFNFESIINLKIYNVVVILHIK